jgi:hypothetical protein
MPVKLTRRCLLLASPALVGCARVNRWLGRGPDADERFLQDDELLRAPVAGVVATPFQGVLEARRFMSYGSCADQGTPLRWLVLATQDKRLPLRIVTDSTLAALRRGDEGALENDSLHGEPLTPEDAARLGLTAGERVQLEGAYCALHFSGTMALVPVYGLCTTGIHKG